MSYTPLGSSIWEQYVRLNSLDQMAPPAADLQVNGKRLTNLGAPVFGTDAAQFGQIGTLLAATYYNGSQTYTRAATAFAVIDATNLTVGPFTAIGTQCLVELYANYCFNAGTTDTGNQVWCLFTHGGGQISGGYHVFAKGAGATLATNATPTPTTARILVTGLVAGTSYQWDWAWDVTAASTTATINTGSATSGTGATTDYGPAMMRVFAA